MNLHDHVFDFGVGFQGVDSHFPSIAALFESAKRCGGVKYIVAVDLYRSCI